MATHSPAMHFAKRSASCKSDEPIAIGYLRSPRSTCRVIGANCSLFMLECEEGKASAEHCPELEAELPALLSNSDKMTLTSHCTLGRPVSTMISATSR